MKTKSLENDFSNIEILVGTILVVFALALSSVLIALVGNMRDRAVDTCIANGYMESYCESMVK